MESFHNKSKKRPTKVEEMTKEQIRQAILKKRECNVKALKIVESLIDGSVSEQYLLKCLPDINQTHFDDIVEERFIVHLCGYPICEHQLSEKDIPKQKYRISLKTNKVYDITVRKNFCSNTCYKAAMFLKKQMLTSPLWFREYETIPVFHILPLDSSGSMGQEVDVIMVEKVQIKEEEKFTSINDFAKATFTEMSINQLSSEVPDEAFELNNKLSEPDIKIDNTENNNVNIETTRPERQEPQTLNTIQAPEQAVKKLTPNCFNIVGEVIEKPEKKIDPILTQQPIQTNRNNLKKLPQKKQPLVTALTIEVEKCLAQWFTLDTMLFLFGEERVTQMVADKGECIKEYLNNYTKGIFYNSNAYDQYQQLCKKLNMLELEERRCDSQILQKETKPLPDYSILKEESSKMELKVRAFFKGETEILSPEMIEKDNQPNDNENITHLPLVDKNAQNALRRRIVSEHLNKVLPDLLRSLGLLSLTISSDVRLLINTFKLKADNIMFKPIQWNFIALIFIKLLSIRDQRLEYLLEKQMAYQHMQLLLLSYKQDGGYLDRLIAWLTDVDRLLDTNDTQLTIE